MNKPISNALKTGIFIFLISLSSILYAAETDQAPTPLAVMPETSFEFPPAVEGDVIIHDFIIQNKGGAVLNVLNVKTS
jgi:hypothetical protein